MRNTRLKKLTTAAILTAAALIVFIIEAQLPPITPVPGIKLGLANIFSLFALFTMGPAYAAAVLLCRVVLGGLITGQGSAIIYSLAGGLPSIAVSAIVYRAFAINNVWALSVVSAVLHNIGQLTAAVLITGTGELFAYLPLLIISGVVTGVFTGLCAQFTIRRLFKLNIVIFRGNGGKYS